MKPRALSLLVAMSAACGGPATTTAPPKEPTVTDPTTDTTPTTKPPTEPPPTAAEAFLASCRQRIATAKSMLPALTDAATPRTVDGVLVGYNDLLIALSGASATAGLHAEVNPDGDVREAARTCEQEAAAFGSELGLHRPLYDALVAVDVRGADPLTQRFHARALRDYRRSGVDKDDATRERLRAIDEKLTELGQKFQRVLGEEVGEIAIDPSELAGLPADYIAARPPGPDGKVRITTDYPDLVPFLTYAESDARRRDLYVVNRSRGAATNPETLREVLTLRAEKAKILGFADWADYITADKMMGSGKAAATFIDRIWKLAAKRSKADYAELLRELKKTDPKAKAVADWQKTWLEEKVKKSTYAVSGEEVRPYFPFQQTLEGLLAITSEIYELRYQRVTDAGAWHPSVQVFDVFRGDARLGRVYLDMHPRDGKYKHAAQFTVVEGIAGRQLPEGALICNFPEPKGDDPGLMEHDDVVTMFHEFGHLMHHVLGGQQKWITQTGVATEWDFVEAPSQMFEEWAWSHATLSRFAKHHQTGEVIPEALVAKMRKADAFGKGTQTVQQMFYAALSLGFHRADPAKLDQLAEVKRLQAKYTPFAYVEGTQFQASFGHLIGYSAIYYTYMWSLVIAKDLLTPFAKVGLMDPKTTRAYRDKILAAGGTKDAADLVRDFLGRPYAFDAYEKYLAQ